MLFSGRHRSPLHPDAPLLLAGNRCLDFANTATGREQGGWRDYLAEPLDLLAWCKGAGTLQEGEYAGMLRRLVLDEPGAGRVFERALRLRGALIGIFISIAHGERPPDGDLAVLNDELVRMRAGEKIVWTPSGFAVEWESPDGRALDAILRPIIMSAVDLLTGPLLGRVKQCASNRCEWLFLDTSKNGSRRWCRMSVCGNREKGRRHHARVSGA